MPGFDFICPMNYPNRCDLPQTEVDYLVKEDGKKVGFLMYQFDKQDKYLETAIKSYFEPRNCHVLDARSEPGTGVRICKICRLATASHFGVGVLSPQNFNAYLEMGLIWGQGKPILFIVNEKQLGQKKKLGDLAFDVSSFMYIVYSTQKELEEGLRREGPIFLEKVRVVGLYQQELVKSVRDKLKKLKALDPENIEFLKMVLLIGKENFGYRFINSYLEENFKGEHLFRIHYDHYLELISKVGFMETEKYSGSDLRVKTYHFSSALLPILRQEVFKEIE